MNETFSYLGYAVLKLPTDLARSQLRAAIKAIASVELRDSFPILYRRIVVYFTGHGGNGCIYTPDGKVQLEEITMPLSPYRAPHLEFLTKIFIFDTCSMIKDSLSHSIFRNSIHLFPALPGNLAFTENDDCGLMTRHLSLALRTSQKSFADIVTDVAAAMRKEIEKNPQWRHQISLDSQPHQDSQPLLQQTLKAHVALLKERQEASTLNLTLLGYNIVHIQPL